MGKKDWSIHDLVDTATGTPAGATEAEPTTGLSAAWKAVAGLSFVVGELLGIMAWLHFSDWGPLLVLVVSPLAALVFWSVGSALGWLYGIHAALKAAPES